MKNSLRSHELFLVFAVIAVAAFLRFYGIGWGLPQIYEEATPLKRAWEMFGWGPQDTLDLNPHFFNYPSLFLYIQFVGQGILYLGMKVFDAVDSTMDFRVLYVLHKTPFFLMGRTITVLFSISTVWVIYSIGRDVMGRTMALAASFLLAINTVHIAKSQAIGVDVPMTFFVILALCFAVRLLTAPILRNYLLAGLAIGLATSTKYTAALLLLPLLAAHLLGTKKIPHSRSSIVGGKLNGSWIYFGFAVALAVLVFFITSPYVILDSSTFLQHLSLEREHMSLGHFGQDTSPTWLFYMQSFSSRIFGWPLTILALFGLVYFGAIRKRSWAIVLAAFFLPYMIAVVSWAMKADRYLMPVLPIILLFAGGMFAEGIRSAWLTRVGPGRRFGIIALAILLFAIPVLAKFPEHMKRLKPDTRTEAKKWIEANIPAGSYILTEYYGPELFGPKELRSLEFDLMQEMLSRKTDVPLYAVQVLPLMQVMPERSGVFYDLSLYDAVDVIIISGGARSRYLMEPKRFHLQVAFYENLERRFEKVREFLPGDGTGPAIAIYKNQKQRIPFAKRGSVEGPGAVEPAGEKITRGEEYFYDNLGLIYEMYGYFNQALESYELAFHYHITQASVYRSLILGRIRCLLALGRSQEAVALLEIAGKHTPSQKDRIEFLQLRREILSGGMDLN
jgi:4-amino-4-deoxy-L-arabinose transferase-like glycosyltransferase